MYKIKCSSCSHEFELPYNSKSRRYIWVNCPACDHRMCIVFVGKCPTCNKNVGFRQAFFQDTFIAGIDFLKQIPNIAYRKGPIIKDFFGGLKNAYKGMTGELKKSEGYGHCCFCNKISHECPYCGNIQHISHVPRFQEDIICKKCGKKFICDGGRKR